MFFDRHEGGENAILIHILFPSFHDNEDLDEFELLARSAGLNILDSVTGSRKQPHSRYFIGSGKLEELKQQVQTLGVDVVLFNHFLSPSQERNLEKELCCKVVDRTGLILDIFAQRARTFEGRLQVELAQLQHLSTRLIRGWTHLERQKGGIGMRGPGETQLETDRRLVRGRISSIERRLKKVRSARQQGRRSRQRSELPTVSLVGYTNAGKSTLFNRLTEADVYVADQLFATLDPTLRRLDVPEYGAIVLADTVGFIRHLPHKLVDAFRATLEETVEADLLLHVTDAAAQDREGNQLAVNEVLSDVGAAEVPVLHVYNKVDLLEGQQARIDRDDQGVPIRVWLSAVDGKGLDLLMSAVCERLGDTIIRQKVRIPVEYSRLCAHLFEHNALKNEEWDDYGALLADIAMREKDLTQLLSRLDIEPSDIGVEITPLSW